MASNFMHLAGLCTSDAGVGLEPTYEMLEPLPGQSAFVAWHVATERTVLVRAWRRAYEGMKEADALREVQLQVCA
jgi:hypothetical protein